MGKTKRQIPQRNKVSYWKGRQNNNHSDPIATEIATLRGIIVPANLDENFDATSLMILTDNEEDFLIDHNFLEAQLFRYLRKPVRLTGMIWKDSGGKNVITVSDFEPLEK